MWIGLGCEVSWALKGLLLFCCLKSAYQGPICKARPCPHLVACCRFLPSAADRSRLWLPGLAGPSTGALFGWMATDALAELGWSDDAVGRGASAQPVP